MFKRWYNKLWCPQHLMLNTLHYLMLNNLHCRLFRNRPYRRHCRRHHWKTDELMMTRLALVQRQLTVTGATVTATNGPESSEEVSPVVCYIVPHRTQCSAGGARVCVHPAGFSFL